MVAADLGPSSFAGQSMDSLSYRLPPAAPAADGREVNLGTLASTNVVSHFVSGTLSMNASTPEALIPPHDTWNIPSMIGGSTHRA